MIIPDVVKSVYEEKCTQVLCSAAGPPNGDINSAVGDSGYMSYQDHLPITKLQEAHLQPHMLGNVWNFQNYLLPIFIDNKYNYMCKLITLPTKGKLKKVYV